MIYRNTLKYIFFIAFSSAISFVLINTQVIFPSFNKVLIQNTEDDAIRIAEHLISFAVLDKNLINISEDSISVIEKTKENFNLEKIKVFSEKGEVIYSTNSQDIGKINKKDYFYSIVANGNVYTTLVKKDTKTLEDRIVKADVIETYVPIMENNTFMGAFEIYYDITTTKHVLNNTGFSASLITFSMMFGIFVIVTILLLKTDISSHRMHLKHLSSIYQSPFFILAFMFAAIFTVELCVMLFLTSLPPMSGIAMAALDSSLLVMLVSPFLYMFLLRPLMLHIGERNEAEDKLKESHAVLEKRVTERTAELAATNRQLTDDIKKRKLTEELLYQTKHDWEDTFNTITDIITIHDKNYNIILANKAAKKILGLPFLGASKPKCYKYYHGTDVPPADCVSCDCIATGKPSISEVYEPHLGNYVEIRAIPRFNSDNELIGIIHVLRNITDRKRSEKAIQDSEERYRSLVESTEDSVYLVDRDYNYLYINKKHLSRLGISEKEYVGQPFSKFHSSDESELFNEKIDVAFSTGLSRQHEYQSLKDGRHFLQTFSPVKGSDGEFAAVTIISKEITKRKHMEEKLRVLSITDELTGLYNRRGFFTLADKQLKLARRQEKEVILLYADLDNFKMINDRYGHLEGDLALRETSSILRSICRSSDVIARIGGDEFVIMSFESQETSYDTIADRLKASLDAYNTKSGNPYDLSLSLGVIRGSTEHSLSAEKLLSRADNLMYEQKKQKQKI
jgi:diguanylate cyclase (GGDEF)-like protein/PAS domain S-box-containing protein